MVIVKMISAVLAPVFLAILFFLLDTRTKFGKIRTLYKQILIGTSYGILACLATQFGITYEGYVMNVRSAAPLTAGLLFGGPAGLIAGVIGAAYRWFSVFWGIPAYTRVACTFATLLAGVIGTVTRRYMFSNKKASWFYGMFLAMATEVLHMLLVFMTHMDDIRNAFAVVQDTAIPMISANSLSLLLSMLLVSMLSKEKLHEKKYTRPITQTFSAYLLVCVLVSFLATSIFTYDLQDNVSRMETERLLSMNISDVKQDIRLATDKDLISRAEEIKAKAEKAFSFPSVGDKDAVRRILKGYLDTYNVTEIHLIDRDGIIAVSSDAIYEGMDMATGGQAEEFLCLLNGTDSYAQDFGPMDYDPSVSRKYAGVSMSHGGFLQVGYDFEHFEDSIKSNLENIATNRHIGQNGFMFILSGEDGSVVSAPANTVTSENIAAFSKDLASLPDGEILNFTTLDGEDYYYSKIDVEGYTVVGCLPRSEASFSRNMSVYIGAFMQLMVFSVLFVVVFLLIKKIIIDNIHKINQSLAKISGGDLSTRVDIRESEEFSSLSNDINSTVEQLKKFISDAEKRIDMELAFAKSIQHSVLPSVFPPYPNRKEFDIYATMDTAKEVGGDFYDFYLLNEDNLVFLIADVSGKGIPSAMFMMNAKSVIKSLTESGLPVAEVFTEANEKLCATNEAGMFVTAWMGVLNLKTGVVKYTNAGHNPPLIKRSNGTFEYFKSHPCLVLAGMEGMFYRENELVLEDGDEVFLYTDGVTEATDANTELYGEERLRSVLNAANYLTAEEICRVVKKRIDDFVGEAPQFDDITMLSLKYFNDRGRPGMSKLITVPAVVESVDTVTDFVDAELEAADCTPKMMMQLNVAIDEIFSNIVYYAYPNSSGDVTVEVCIDDTSVRVVFTDSGVPFDPLKMKDPDIKASAEDRTIGGLGIFMVKKTMDSVEYENRDGKNILTITKNR